MVWKIAALGAIVFISNVVKIYNTKRNERLLTDLSDISNQSNHTAKKTHPDKKYYLKVKIGDSDTSWEENFFGSLPSVIKNHVLINLQDILFDHIDRKDDEVDVNVLGKRVITIQFSVETYDDQFLINGLDDFQRDLSSNIYSMAECVVMIKVLTQLITL